MSRLPIVKAGRLLHFKLSEVDAWADEVGRDAWIYGQGEHPGQRTPGQEPKAGTE